jgi:hypothetical protein
MHARLFKDCSTRVHLGAGQKALYGVFSTSARDKRAAPKEIVDTHMGGMLKHRVLIGQTS